jgi:CRISPR-associated protein (Cas_Cas02710)
MTTLQTLWEEYKTLEISQREAFYNTNIWTLIKEKFNSSNNSEYDVSFHTLGTSAEPVILAALKLGAPKVYLLHTNETQAMTTRIIAELEQAEVTLLEVNRSDSSSIYRAVSQHFQPNTRTAFEITSGTKAMVSSLAMLAAHLKVHLYYLENPRWDAQMRRPEPGFEELIMLEMPDVPTALD